MQQYVSPTQLLRGPFRWIAITAFNAGATIQINDEHVIAVDGKYIIVAPPHDPFDTVLCTGVITILTGNMQDVSPPRQV